MNLLQLGRKKQRGTDRLKTENTNDHKSSNAPHLNIVINRRTLFRWEYDHSGSRVWGLRCWENLQGKAAGCWKSRLGAQKNRNLETAQEVRNDYILGGARRSGPWATSPLDWGTARSWPLRPSSGLPGIKSKFFLCTYFFHVSDPSQHPTPSDNCEPSQTDPLPTGSPYTDSSHHSHFQPDTDASGRKGREKSHQCWNMPSLGSRKWQSETRDVPCQGKEQLKWNMEFDSEETKLHVGHVNLRKVHLMRTGDF